MQKSSFCLSGTRGAATIRRVVRTAALLGLMLAVGDRAVLSQTMDKSLNLAERLGYSSDAKLLILHADDIGMSHSVNAATIRAFELGAVNSGSIMVPCPWFPQIAEYARERPEIDLGLHLTLTAEWPTYKWGPVLPVDQVPSLVDERGFLHPGIPETATIKAEEAEAELRAQVNRALDFGIRPTHLDTHMGVLLSNPQLVESYLRVGQEFGLPVLLTTTWMTEDSQALVERYPWAQAIATDRVVSIPPGVDWPTYYREVIETLQPGVTELIVHVGYDNEELRAATGGIEDWGSAWRQKEFDVLTSPEFEEILAANNVQLVTWREIGSLLRK